MFADDTLFYKNDESVKKSFDILTIYEKASGSTVNYESKNIMIPSSSSRSVYYITSCIRRLASLILRPFTNPFWSACK
jgi:hypothetical protein